MILFLKNLLFTVFVPGMVAGFVPYWMLAGRRVAGASLGAGALMGALGLAIYGWCLWDFAITGRGTPAPIDPPKVLVARGLYRWTRNPMYVGVLSVIAGWAIAFQSRTLAVYLVLVALMFHVFVRVVEEPMLQRKFGPAYEQYRRAVPRWLPSLPS